MKPLPHVGRPSLTGLSIKQLGKPEYDRQYQTMFPKKYGRNYWSKLIGITVRKARSLLNKKKTKITGRL